jgi:hypothetical protein
MERCAVIFFFVENKPCAFGWGELAYKRFVFQQTGYDPDYRKLSPGTALMMRMIRDLIEHTDCEVFDFLWGGDEGYKSRLGTVSVGLCVDTDGSNVPTIPTSNCRA